MIKKAKRVPEEVEYFVWDGDKKNLPDNWGSVFDLDENGDLYIKDGLLQGVKINDIIVKYSGGEVWGYSPADFEYFFVPLPPDK